MSEGFIGIGTVINVIAIILGAFIGRVSGSRLSEKSRTLMTDVLGAVTLIGAASALISFWDKNFISAVPKGAPIIIILLSLLIGGLIGSVIGLEDRLENWGERLKARFSRDSESRFVEGFVTASLIFVIGPLAILGSISDGMQAGIDQLILKSILDFFAAIAFAAAMGWGVALSALPVGIYQGLWTLVGIGLGNVLADYQVAAMTATGGVLLFGIAMKLLSIKKIEIGNLLPALALAPLLALLAQNLK